MKTAWEREIAIEAAVLEAEADVIATTIARLRGQEARARGTAMRLWKLAGAGERDRRRIREASGHARLAVAEQASVIEIGKRVVAGALKLR